MAVSKILTSPLPRPNSDSSPPHPRDQSRTDGPGARVCGLSFRRCPTWWCCCQRLLKRAAVGWGPTRGRRYYLGVRERQGRGVNYNRTLGHPHLTAEDWTGTSWVSVKLYLCCTKAHSRLYHESQRRHCTFINQSCRVRMFSCTSNWMQRCLKKFFLVLYHKTINSYTWRVSKSFWRRK